MRLTPDSGRGVIRTSDRAQVSVHSQHPLNETFFLLALGACGRGAARQKLRCAAPHELFKLIKDLRVPPSLGHLELHGLKRVRDREGSLVRPYRSQCVVYIDNLQNSACDWHVLSLKTVRIT